MAFQSSSKRREAHHSIFIAEEPEYYSSLSRGFKTPYMGQILSCNWEGYTHSLRIKQNTRRMEKAQGQYGAEFTAADTALNGLLCETDGWYDDNNDPGILSYRNLKHTITSMMKAISRGKLSLLKAETETVYEV